MPKVKSSKVGKKKSWKKKTPWKPLPAGALDYRDPNPIKSEMKNVEFLSGSVNVESYATAGIISNPQPGTGVNEYVGNSYTVRGHLFRGFFRINSTTIRSANIRVILVYDTQPGNYLYPYSATASWNQTLLTASFINAPTLAGRPLRFTKVYDEVHRVSDEEPLTLNFYRKCLMPIVNYGTMSGAAPSSGCFRIYVFGDPHQDGSGNILEAQWSWRMYFSDQ